MCNGRSSKAYFGTSYLDDLDFSILIRSPPFRGRLSVLGWTAFGMSSTMSILVMTELAMTDECTCKTEKIGKNAPAVDR